MLPMLHVVFWNTCLAAGLATVVFLAQRIPYLRRQPNLWHALWLLVLVKLVTPPIFAIPVSLGSSGSEPFQDDHLAAPVSLDGQADEALLTKTTEAILTPQFAVAVSAVGTIALLLVSLSRVRLIGRLVRQAELGPQWMQEAAASAARQLKLKRVPSVRTVNGIVSPFLWAAPRGPLVVVPCQLARMLDRESISLVIKHELAHYARRDHWANAFSMILGTLFWWNPVVWWARRELRILQESCCDRMVLASDTSQRCRYAEALLKTVDFVASDGAAFPTPATAFGSCGTFKRRLEMIVLETPNRVNSRRWQAYVLFCAIIVLPLGVMHAQDAKKDTPNDRTARVTAARGASTKDAPNDRTRVRPARGASTKDAPNDRTRVRPARGASTKDAPNDRTRVRPARGASTKDAPNDRVARGKAAREASTKDAPKSRVPRVTKSRVPTVKDTPNTRAARAKAARETSKRAAARKAADAKKAAARKAADAKKAAAAEEAKKPEPKKQG